MHRLEMACTEGRACRSCRAETKGRRGQQPGFAPAENFRRCPHRSASALIAGVTMTFAQMECGRIQGGRGVPPGEGEQISVWRRPRRYALRCLFGEGADRR